MKNISEQEKDSRTKNAAEGIAIFFCVILVVGISTQLLPLIVGIFYIATTPSEMLIPLLESIDYRLNAAQVLKSVYISFLLAFIYLICEGKLITPTKREVIKLTLILIIIFCPIVKIHDHLKPAATEHRIYQYIYNEMNNALKESKNNKTEESHERF